MSSSRLREIGGMTIAALLGSAVLISAQTFYHTFNGIRYRWPTTHVAGVLTSNGASSPVLSWSPEIPSGIVAFNVNGNCANGWTAYTAAEGRVLVGLPVGGTNAATIGTALTNTENRLTGQHAHPGSLSTIITDTGHTHSITEPNSGQGHQHTIHSSGGDASAFLTDFDAMDGVVNTGTSTTGITINSGPSGLTVSASTTINNAGTGTDTNAPYIQLKICEKQ